MAILPPAMDCAEGVQRLLPIVEPMHHAAPGSGSGAEAGGPARRLITNLCWTRPRGLKDAGWRRTGDAGRSWPFLPSAQPPAAAGSLKRSGWAKWDAIPPAGISSRSMYSRWLLLPMRHGFLGSQMGGMREAETAGRLLAAASSGPSSLFSPFSYLQTQISDDTSLERTNPRRHG